MTIPHAPFAPISTLFLCAPDSDLSMFLDEVHRLATGAPALLAAIDSDLDAHGRRKKALPSTAGRTRTFRVVKVTLPRRDRHGKSVGGSEPRWYLTNLARETWTPEMISAVYRLRWSIERTWRQARTLARLDQLRSERPAVVFAFVAASVLVWLLGALMVRELERQEGVGPISQDRVLAVWIEAIPEVTRVLRGERDTWKRLLRWLLALVKREGRHPNPSQPRVVTQVFDTLEFERELHAEAA
jgi:hypothetical protein